LRCVGGNEIYSQALIADRSEAAGTFAIVPLRLLLLRGWALTFCIPSTIHSVSAPTSEWQEHSLDRGRLPLNILGSPWSIWSTEGGHQSYYAHLERCNDRKDLQTPSAANWD